MPIVLNFLKNQRSESNEMDRLPVPPRSLEPSNPPATTPSLSQVPPLPRPGLSPRSKWGLMLLMTLAFPFAAWVIGSLIVWVTPPVYRSAVLVPVPPGAGSDIVEREMALFRDGPVSEEALRSLQSAGFSVPANMLRDSVSIEAQSVPDSTPSAILVEAHGAEPAQAQRRALAYADAYEHYLAAQGTQDGFGIRVDPPSLVPVDTSPERRIVLGIGGLAFVGLLLAIPFLRVIEKAVPLRVMPTR